MPKLLLNTIGLAIVLGKCGIALTQERQAPPYRGTIFDFPDLIKESDKSAFKAIRFVEVSQRKMFDRRVNEVQSFPVFVFEVEFTDRRTLEVAVNREFETESAALLQAERYAIAFGRLPLMLRTEIDALHIQAGKQLFGGGREILIHTGQAEEYFKEGILEETLGHEAGHALDNKLAKHPDWIAAQKIDGRFISVYAEENPFREDIAESVIPYLAARYRPDRITKEQLETITESIPARMRFFDELDPKRAW